MIIEKRRAPIGSILLTILIICGAVAVYINRVPLLDWWALRSYQAPPAIAKLADETTMNGRGRQLFFLSKPALQDKENFNNSCRENEQTIVLGCYIQLKGIFLLDVEDPRLDGVEQVTSAHEMLHAAYQRLDSKERARVNALITQAYDNLQDNRILANIKAYQNANADIANELHSILGTEVANLPPDLEAYYKQYFTDRAKIVGFSDKYEAEFTSRKSKIEADDAQLSSLEAQINANNAQLDNLQAALSTQKEQLNALRRNGDIAGYNAGVAPYNLAVKNYNTLINQTNGLIGQYRRILDERNGLAQDLQTLTKALDSRISTRNQL